MRPHPSRIVRRLGWRSRLRVPGPLTESDRKVECPLRVVRFIGGEVTQAQQTIDQLVFYVDAAAPGALCETDYTYIHIC